MEKISMELSAFVSRNPDASYDTSFSSTERPKTPTVEPTLSESITQEQSSQATNETMTIKSEHIIRDECWESQ